eukprot:6210939-Pleurochrysis_carterae.AAC.4
MPHILRGERHVGKDSQSLPARTPLHQSQQLSKRVSFLCVCQWPLVMGARAPLRRVVELGCGVEQHVHYIAHEINVFNKHLVQPRLTRHMPHAQLPRAVDTRDCHGQGRAVRAAR